MQPDEMNLPTQFYRRQRLQRPCGSTGEWLSRTWLCAQEAIGIALLSIELTQRKKRGDCYGKRWKLWVEEKDIISSSAFPPKRIRMTKPTAKPLRPIHFSPTRLRVQEAHHFGTISTQQEQDQIHGYALSVVFMFYSNTDN